MNIRNLGKVNTWLLMEVLGFFLILATGVLCFFWVEQYADNDYYLSGYWPLASTLAFVIIGALNSPMRIRIEKVEARVRTRKAMKTANIPLNTKFSFKWSKTVYIVFFFTISIMLLTILFMGDIIPQNTPFSGVISIAKTLGWFSFALTFTIGLFVLIFIVPSITHPTWMRVESKE